MDKNVFDKMGYLIKRVQNELRVVMDAALESYHLTAAQYAVLSAIEAKDTASNADLARTCFVTPQTMIRIIANLEELGFVRRTDDEHHGRIINIRLTDKGQRTLTKAHAAVEDIETKMLKGLRKTDLESLRSSLNRCLENLAG